MSFVITGFNKLYNSSLKKVKGKNALFKYMALRYRILPTQ